MNVAGLLDDVLQSICDEWLYFSSRLMHLDVSTEESGGELLSLIEGGLISRCL